VAKAPVAKAPVAKATHPEDQMGRVGRMGRPLSPKCTQPYPVLNYHKALLATWHILALLEDRST
jgi:hypothetical protein